MNKQIEALKKTREWLLQLVEDLSIEQLNEIPPGFNNNIIWHIGHLVAGQHSVCYQRAELPLSIDEDFYKRFQPDTKPNGFINREEAEQMKELLLTSVDQLGNDYDAGIFSNYKGWGSRYGLPLNTIDEAIEFLLFHEGLHTGSVMVLKRFVKRLVAARHNTL